MTLKDLKNKRLAIIGLGIENYALLKYLAKKQVDCQITICEANDKSLLIAKYPDLNKIIKNKNIAWQLGKDHYKDLSTFDLIFRSPGSLVAKDNKVKLGQAVITSSINLFFDLCLSKNIIGVTGTKGKGTVSSLIYDILKQGGKKVFLGGNIGIAPFEFIEKIKKTDWVVLELSSFQLEDITSSPYIAVLNNFTKEHLAPADPNNPNYHQTMTEYWQAKLGVAKWQSKNDYLVVNSKLKNKLANLKFVNKIIYFTKSDLPTKLPGQHNKENIAAAVAVAKLVKIKATDIARAVAKFKGLEYRIELTRKFKDVSYYNDSFATTPEAAITALKSFNQPIILLAGGADKGSDFKALAKEIKKKTKFVVLLKGQGTNKIKKELNKIKYPSKNMQEVASMKAAVSLAAKQAVANDLVLLSTGCASFGMFKNYKERGKLFREEVDSLK